MKVVDVKLNVMPFNPLKPSTWRMYRPSRPARYVIEIAKGMVGQTTVGDRLSFF